MSSASAQSCNVLASGVDCCAQEVFANSRQAYKAGGVSQYALNTDNVTDGGYDIMHS